MNAQSLGANKTILLVEDELIVRDLITKILRQEGFCVLKAGDGAEALMTAQQRNREIALVLSDVMMPRMDGIKLCESLRRLFPEIPVLLMSGEMIGPIPKYTSLLRKPFTPSELMERVRVCLMAPVDA